jgi:hypothetical protein
MVASGRLRSKGDIAAVFGCNQGGVSWPDNIVIYDAKRRIIGSIDLGRVTRGGREYVRRLWIANRHVHVQVAGIGQRDDAGCCGTASALLRIRWSSSKRRLEVRSKKLYTERAAARRFVRAVRDGDRQAARRVASPQAVKEIFAARSGRRVSLGPCIGALSDHWASSWLRDSKAPRMCLLYFTVSQGEGDSAYALFMGRRGWKDWFVSSSRGIAG